MTAGSQRLSSAIRSLSALQRPVAAHLAVLLLAMGLLMLTGLSGCGSTGPSRAAAAADAGSVTYVDYERGFEMRIVSDSWLIANGIEGETAGERRAAFYSDKTRTGPLPKVCDDDVMAGIRQMLDHFDFARYARTGAAPAPGGSAGLVVDKAIEFGRGPTLEYIVHRDGLPAEQTLSFMESIQGLVEIYNRLDQHQAIEGEVRFQQPRLGSGQRP